MNKIVEFEELKKSNLLVDAIYKGGQNKNLSSEPINKIMGCGNQGGFRRLGSPDNLKLVVIYTTNEDKEWTDLLDVETGMYIYYGDNKKPGSELHDTPKKGNLVLKNIFDNYHAGKRENIPPLFIFSKANNGYDVIYRGLAVPSYPGYSQVEDLVAVWKTSDNERFQNYKAVFSILNEQQIDRRWIVDILNGKTLESKFCPVNYSVWVKTGKYNLLKAPKTKKYRTKEEQLPENKADLRLLEYVIKYFHDQGRNGDTMFEKCAAELLPLMDKNFIGYDLTRPSRDGGRDGIGTYKIGMESNSITVTYAIEAKCYSTSTSVGVKGTSRLISRLLHRQFGVFVTTSYIGKQAYCEIREEDNHPLIIISGIDIISIFKKSGLSTIEQIREWLDSLYVNIGNS